MVLFGKDSDEFDKDFPNNDEVVNGTRAHSTSEKLHRSA
jgi:hypothetical protein